MNTYEVWGDGITTSIIERGKIIHGKTPMDALRRAGIRFVRRIHSLSATPEKWIYVHRIRYFEDGTAYFATSDPCYFYEV